VALEDLTLLNPAQHQTHYPQRANQKLSQYSCLTLTLCYDPNSVLLILCIGASLSGNRMKRLTPEDVAGMLATEELALAVQSTLAVLHCVEAEIHKLECTVTARGRLSPVFQPLLTVFGIGRILALTIMLEAGDIRRFATVWQFASYCRCVSRIKFSNGKRKGQGNTKNGNKYLA